MRDSLNLLSRIGVIAPILIVLSLSGVINHHLNWYQFIVEILGVCGLYYGGYYVESKVIKY